MGDMLARENFEVTLLPQPSDNGITGIGYDAWLGVTQQEDAAQTITALGSQQSDWLVVDHYGIDRVWEARLRPHTHRLMVIDDLANRPHDCDVLLDQNYADGGLKRYQAWVPADCRLLLGPRYALLQPEYAKYRETLAPRTGEINRIMVYMGGSDHSNITGMVLGALSANQLADIDVDVVIGSHFLHKGEVMAQASARPKTNIHSSRPHLADLMAKADLAIGGGGATTWERMCLGLPSIVTAIAENQVPACKALDASGLILFQGNATKLDIASFQKAISKELTEAKNLRELSEKNRNLVDGKGTSRVIEVLDPSPIDKLKLRPAISSDALIYLQWVNDSEVRSNAKNTNLIQMLNHLEWFDQRIRDTQSYLFVLEAGNLPVGQIRFERHDEEAVVDYSLDVSVRNRGWAKQLIKLGVEALKPKKPVMLKATVKRKNVSSAKALIQAGFTEIKKAESHDSYRHFQLFLLNTENTTQEASRLKQSVVSK
jgi:UDP-2,4-diacetamido-2,4,6-trideoxy-beta-L-altropyranose hydrolase